MTNQKFASGAFVFTRAKGMQPQDPESVKPVAQKHGFDEKIVPPYAGDRAAVGRAIQATSSGLYREGFLLRPIRRSGSEVVYGIVREQKEEVLDHLKHNHEATISWRAESNPERIEGEHPIADRVRFSYSELRGKLVAEDWSATVTSELEKLGAVAFREDGRVYWCPPQSLESVKRLGAFLAEVGVTLVMAEVEAETTTVVKNVVSESVADQLDRLQAEVQNFDAHQKPSMFARRLDEYQKLRERAILYRDALGIGAERTEQVLAELEVKVSAMLDVRQKTTIHRNGSVTRRVEEKSAPVKVNKPEPIATPAIETKTALNFAGAKFVAADSSEPNTLMFISSDEKAKSTVAILESMGVAGKYQKAGTAEVCIQNSGPPGAETSIRIRLPENTDIASAAKSFAALGIELAS